MTQDRWSERGPDDASDEGRAGRLLRSVEVPEPTLDPDAILARASDRRRRVALPIPVMAAGVIVALLAGGVLAATLLVDRAPPSVAKKDGGRPAAQETELDVDVETDEIETDAEPALEPESARAVDAERGPKVAPRRPIVAEPAPRRALTADPPAPPPEAAPVREVDVVRSAVAAMKRGDAETALVEVARYEAAFPDGPLAREVFVTKVTALMALERSAEALAALEPRDLASYPNAVTLWVLRAELRVADGRCADAVEDLAAAERAGARGDLAARVEAARRHCRP